MNIPRCRLVAACLASLVIGSCGKPFDPLQPSDLVFSIHGILEASTGPGHRQWVRVTSVRTALATEPGPIDAVVTLEELGTGRSVVMTDSLVRYQSPFFPDTAAYAHNFSTTMQLMPGREYRLTATRSDGAQTSATVRIPVVVNPRLAHQVAPTPGTPPRFYVLGAGRIGLAFNVYELASACPYHLPYSQQYLPIIEYGDPNRLLPAFWGGWPSTPPEWARVSSGPPCWPVSRSLQIVVPGTPWPFPLQQGRLTPGPRTSDNMVGGVGFLVGVQSLVCFSNTLTCRFASLFDGSLPW